MFQSKWHLSGGKAAAEMNIWGGKCNWEGKEVMRELAVWVTEGFSSVAQQQREVLGLGTQQPPTVREQQEKWKKLLWVWGAYFNYQTQESTVWRSEDLSSLSQILWMKQFITRCGSNIQNIRTPPPFLQMQPPRFCTSHCCSFTFQRQLYAQKETSTVPSDHSQNEPEGRRNQRFHSTASARKQCVQHLGRRVFVNKANAPQSRH